MFLASLQSYIPNLKFLKSISEIKKGEPKAPKTLPVKQSQVIEEITQENTESFLKKFAWAAKSDLCEEGGVLNTQWKKWADLNKLCRNTRYLI
ncbi:MAG: hypothetical protein HXY43_07070 [Fischerella sp.]|jgi:hypothetical protein|uniref:hypothetical protein n=1 Tax=Fischerella sp. TaxID=1191 RepID=UPI0004BCA67C|nr:hypothetical protein [Fischerella sp.]NWF59058.1 hypothetical protein [Fischerella sp.]